MDHADIKAALSRRPRTSIAGVIERELFLGGRTPEGTGWFVLLVVETHRLTASGRPVTYLLRGTGAPNGLRFYDLRDLSDYLIDNFSLTKLF